MSVKKKGGLGRGLNVFFSEPAIQEVTAENPEKSDVSTVSILMIDPNPNQPRRTFDEEKLQELADSIREHGILQPPVVVKRGERYHLVAGERRWRAARLADLKEIPVRVMDLSDEEIAEISLIENLQRDDLSPMEEAAGIRALMDGFSLTQEEAAKRLGKSRSAVANALRLLNLPEDIRGMVNEGKLSAGHARVLAGISDPALARNMAQKAVDEGLNVRQMEEWSRNAAQKKPAAPKKDRIPQDPAFRELQEALSRMMGTKVTVKGSLDAGRITVEYYAREDLERIYELAMRHDAGV